MSWTDHLPCGVDLGIVPNGPFRLLVTATDGDTVGADVRDATLTMPSSMIFTGASCDDNNPCTIDVCGASGCEHTPIVCEGGASGCSEAPSCDPSTGQCMAAPKADGSSCDDGNACTTGETCTAGACDGGTPMVCEGAAGPCEDAPTCDPATGQCMAAAEGRRHVVRRRQCLHDERRLLRRRVPAGTPKTCEGGATRATKRRRCDPATGQCVDVNKPERHHAATTATPARTGDTCQAGACVGRRAGRLHRRRRLPRRRHLRSGDGSVCSIAAKPDGTRCDDGNACTQPDACQAGACTGGSPVVCTAS